jgi:hypothetical protein
LRLSDRLGILKLPPELFQINSMPGRFPFADENHRNFPIVALFQNRILIDIDLAKAGAEFLQERRDGGLGFVAKVASGARVESDVAWAASGKAGIFGMGAHRFGAKAHLTGERARLGRTVGKNGA